MSQSRYCATWRIGSVERSPIAWPRRMSALRHQRSFTSAAATRQLPLTGVAIVVARMVRLAEAFPPWKPGTKRRQCCRRGSIQSAVACVTKRPVLSPRAPVRPAAFLPRGRKDSVEARILTCRRHVRVDVPDPCDLVRRARHLDAVGRVLIVAGVAALKYRHFCT